MPYQIELGESVEKAVRRIAANQLDHALAALDDADDSFDAVVHEVRRRCKRLRAVVRLVRPSLAEFHERDAWLRDTAAPLSHARDAAVLRATHRRIVTNVGSGVDLPALAQALGIDGPGEASMADAHRAALAEVKERLELMRASVHRWRLGDHGFSAVRAGLRLAYARSRRAMNRAQSSQSPADCHRWRKRVKYHMFQMRILRELWPQAMQARETAATELGDLLGAAHDLANYRETVDAARAGCGRDRSLVALQRAATELEQEMLARSWPIGQRLFVLAPGVFVAELEAYWDAWRRS
jgi:CHAD domain-containing protein